MNVTFAYMLRSDFWTTEAEILNASAVILHTVSYSQI